MSKIAWIQQLKISILFICLALGEAQANVVGADSQNFNPITSGLDFVTVHSSETLEPGILNFGFFLNYGVNSLPYFEGDGTTEKTEFADSLLGGDINLGVGLMRGWDAGVSFPQVLSQEVEGNGARLRYGDLGITEMRANSKVRLTGDKDGGTAVIGSVNINHTKDNPFVGEGAGPTYNLEFAADATLGKWALGGNFGYRWRDSGKALSNALLLPFENQYIASAAASYLFPEYDTKMIFEIFSSWPAKNKDANYSRKQQSAEFLAGLKHDFSSSLAGHFGAGTELMQGAGSPDYRIYLGINYAIGPIFSQPEPARVSTETDPYAGGLLDLEPPTQELTEESVDTLFDKTPVGGEETFLLGDILFDFNKDTLMPQAKTLLDKLSAYLMKPPEFSRLVIEGHTDSVGSNAYNRDLSHRRAQSVERYLASVRGLDSDRIEAEGFGEIKPVADNGNYQGRMKNRRVEIVITRPRTVGPDGLPLLVEEEEERLGPGSSIRIPRLEPAPGAKPIKLPANKLKPPVKKKEKTKDKTNKSAKVKKKPKAKKNSKTK